MCSSWVLILTWRSNIHFYIAPELILKKFLMSWRFSENKAIDWAIFIEENSQWRTVLSGQKGLPNSRAKLNEQMILLPVMGMTSSFAKAGSVPRCARLLSDSSSRISPWRYSFSNSHNPLYKFELAGNLHVA